MQNQLQRLRDERDLDLYERFLNGSNEDVVKPGARTSPFSRQTNRDFVPEGLANTAFLPAFLSRNIGKPVKAEFLIGSRMQTRSGKLLSVGSSFFELKQPGGNTVICDLHSVKFLTVMHT